MEKKIKHSPGPWTWWSEQPNTDRPKGYDLDRIVADNGRHVLDIYGDKKRTAGVQKADYTLLAAAPELLSALEWAMSVIENEVEATDRAKHEAALAAIARATA